MILKYFMVGSYHLVLQNWSIGFSRVERWREKRCFWYSLHLIMFVVHALSSGLFFYMQMPQKEVWGIHTHTSVTQAWQGPVADRAQFQIMVSPRSCWRICCSSSSNHKTNWTVSCEVIYSLKFKPSYATIGHMLLARRGPKLKLLGAKEDLVN
jgi:hypothetical protein